MWRHRRTQFTIGQTRIRLAKKLSVKLTEMYGKPVTVKPEYLWTQQGFYRSRYHDLARWGANLWNPCDGICHIQLASWVTMRDLLKKKSLEIHLDDAGYHEVM